MYRLSIVYQAAANAQAAGAKPKAAKLQKSVTIAGDGDHNGKLSRHNPPLERPRTADLTSKDQQVRHGCIN